MTWWKTSAVVHLLLDNRQNHFTIPKRLSQDIVESHFSLQRGARSGKKKKCREEGPCSGAQETVLSAAPVSTPKPMLDTVLIDQVAGSGYLECGYLVWEIQKTLSKRS